MLIFWPVNNIFTYLRPFKGSKINLWYEFYNPKVFGHFWAYLGSCHPGYHYKCFQRNWKFWVPWPLLWQSSASKSIKKIQGKTAVRFKRETYRVVKFIFLWLFGPNRSVTGIMNLTFSLDFQELVPQVERYRQSKGPCLLTSQLLSVLIATPAKHSGNKIKILTILQQLNAKKI